MSLEKSAMKMITALLISKGFAPETNDLHKRIIEGRVCVRKQNKKCKRTYLVYYGFSDCKNYLCFSYCPNCGEFSIFRHLSDIFTPLDEILTGEVFLGRAA